MVVSLAAVLGCESSLSQAGAGCIPRVLAEQEPGLAGSRRRLVVERARGLLLPCLRPSRLGVGLGAGPGVLPAAAQSRAA